MQELNDRGIQRLLEAVEGIALPTDDRRLARAYAVMGAEAFAMCADTIADLQGVPGEALVGQPEGRNAERRRALRTLVCLWPDLDPADLPLAVCDLCGSDVLTYQHIREILLDAHASELPVETLQAVAAEVRSGAPLREVVATTGASLVTVKRVRQFFGAAQAQAMREARVAARAAREGWTIRALADHLGCSPRKAFELRKQVRSQ